MKCIYCGAEIPESARFCPACGKPVADACPSCGAALPQGAAFCPECGKSVKVSDGGETAATNAAPAAGETAKKFDWNKFFKISAAAMALCLTAFTFIFLFCTGVTPTYSYNIPIDVPRTEVNYFYYFGKAYSDVAGELSQTAGADPFYYDTAYILPVFGTLVSAAALIAVTALSVFAVIRSIGNLTGKTEKTGEGFAVAAYFAYIAGALALLALNAQKAELSMSQYDISVSANAGVQLNGPTIGGIVLGAIFTAALLTFKLLPRGKKSADPGFLSAAAASVLKIIFVLAAAGLTAAAGITMAFPPEILGLTGAGKFNVGLGGVQLSQFIRGLKASMGDALPLNSKIMAAFGLSIISCLLTVAIFVLAAAEVTKTIKRIGAGESRNMFKAVLAALTALIVVNMTISIIAATLVTGAIADAAVAAGEELTIRLSYGPLIAATVLAVLATDAEIVHKVAVNKTGFTNDNGGTPGNAAE